MQLKTMLVGAKRIVVSAAFSKLEQELVELLEAQPETAVPALIALELVKLNLQKGADVIPKA